MTKRQFYFGLFCVVALVFVIGPIGYYTVQTVRENRAAEIEKTKIEEEKATERTKERWKFLNSLPWVDEKD